MEEGGRMDRGERKMEVREEGRAYVHGSTGGREGGGGSMGVREG